jgi:hypothetical protein
MSRQSGRKRESFDLAAEPFPFDVSPLTASRGTPRMPVSQAESRVIHVEFVNKIRSFRLLACGATMTDDSRKRDEVLKRLLKTPPKPHKPPSSKDLDDLAKELGQTDPNADFGSDDWEKRQADKK